MREHFTIIFTEMTSYLQPTASGNAHGQPCYTAVTIGGLKHESRQLGEYAIK